MGIIIRHHHLSHLANIRHVFVYREYIGVYVCTYTLCIHRKIAFHFPKDLRASSFGRLLSHLVGFRLPLEWSLGGYSPHVSPARCQSLYFRWKFSRNQYFSALLSSEGWNLYSLKNWMQFYLFIFVFHCWGKTDEKGTTTLSYTFIILLGDLNLYSITIS